MGCEAGAEAVETQKELFSGVIPAIVTPFDADGKVNVEVAKKLVNHHLDCGVGGFYVCGNTGEGAEMEVDERKKMAKAVVEAVAKKVPVMIHVGGCEEADACVLAAHAKEIGADATSSMPRGADLAAVASYFTAIGGAADLPFYVSWVPSTISDTHADDFLNAMKHVPHMAGIKYTDKNFFKFQQIMARAMPLLGRTLNCLTGPDEMNIAGMAMGSHGAIGSTYNLMPKLNVAMYNAFHAGRVKEATKIQEQCNEVIELLLKHCKINAGGPGTNIISGLKMAYKERGFDCGEAKKFTMTPEEIKAMTTAIKEVEKKFKVE
jgi:dihydrodipicolinate synthase/N-acetylneuraminate lyase